MAEEAKMNVGEAERTIEIVEQALERDDAEPRRKVKTEDRIRLDIPDSILEDIFKQRKMELS